MKPKDLYDEVNDAINIGRLKVDCSTGRIYTRRSIKSEWREATYEEVKAPHQQDPYYRFRFTCSSGGRRCLVHRAVVYASGTRIKQDLTVNHINGIKTDNRLDNLEVVTYSENIKHAMRTGLNSTRKITQGMVQYIVSQTNLGRTRVSLAKELGLERRSIKRVLDALHKI